MYKVHAETVYDYRVYIVLEEEEVEHEEKASLIYGALKSTVNRLEYARVSKCNDQEWFEEVVRQSIPVMDCFEALLKKGYKLYCKIL